MNIAARIFKRPIQGFVNLLAWQIFYESWILGWWYVHVFIVREKKWRVKFSTCTISISMCAIYRSKEAPASWPWLPMAASLPRWEHFSKPFPTMDGATSQLYSRSSQLDKSLFLFCNIMICNHGCISLFVKTNDCRPLYDFPTLLRTSEDMGTLWRENSENKWN